MGAILANVVVTELVILAIYLLGVSFFSSYNQSRLTVLFVVALAFPVAFYHHSWSFWLGFNHLIDALPDDIGHDHWG